MIKIDAMSSASRVFGRDYHTARERRAPLTGMPRLLAESVTRRGLVRRRPPEESAIPPEDVPPYQPQRVQPDLQRLQTPPDPDRFQVTWIGHATFLIQVGGKNFLSDPIYSRCCSPVYLPNLRRLAEPGIPFDLLPRIDGVLISHDHYDHLDRRTIRRLGGDPHYFFPLGITPWFQRLHYVNCHEADWGQSLRFGEISLHCVPAQHFSGRGVFDRNRTLWCGWILEHAGRKLYFAGDSGYSSLFAEIGREHGPIDCSLIPIGAYSPRWFMHPVHVDPREAVKIHCDVHSRQSIASHWGTFQLTNEPPGEPPIYLRKVLREEGLPEESFVTPRFGETLVI